MVQQTVGARQKIEMHLSSGQLSLCFLVFFIEQDVNNVKNKCIILIVQKNIAEELYSKCLLVYETQSHD